MTDSSKAQSLIEHLWTDSILPQLHDYILIPNKSPLFDPQWQAHGHMDEAVRLIVSWCEDQPIDGLTVEVLRLEGRTPLIYMEISGKSGESVLLYGHLDKQPEMSGWRSDLGPWKPVLDGDKLYGRGGADDGYAAFSALAAILALKDQGMDHANLKIVIEACEESGSYDLPYYIDALSDRIGRPDLVICLDSGCGNYDQLWSTTSLRGMLGGNLSVEVLTEGVHSGDASGIVPSSFRILRQLLSRLDDETTGEILAREFYVDIPFERVRQAKRAAQVLGDQVYSKFPFAEGTQPITTDLHELILNRTWRPALSITGAGGLPALSDAGNVLRPETALKLSLRLPPTCDADAVNAVLRQILEQDPPYGARVTFAVEQNASGWNAPPVAPWLDASLEHASNEFFGKPAMYMGEGGSIPFMGMLGEKFPEAQFLITGVLGPHSNAHGPNEFLHIPTAKKITCCVAQVITDHYRRSR